MQNFKRGFLFTFASILILFLAVCFFTGGCSTIDFNPPQNEDVYRIQIENIGTTDVTYRPQVSFYYIDGKKNLELPNGTVTPDARTQLIAESQQGTYGVSVDVQLFPGSSTARLFLERGSGTGDDFTADEVVESKTGTGTIFIRYGEYY